MTKLAICIPARNTVHTGFALSLSKLTSHLTSLGVEHVVLFNLGSVIAQQRNTLVQEALDAKATHILWLDSDMHVPSGTAIKLLEHKKHIVAAAYSTRVPPYKSVGFNNADDIEDRFSATHGLHKVYAVGMGCMLVDTKVYSYIGKPWHHYHYNKDTDNLSGEDIYFCDAAGNAGFDVYIDAELSHEVAHYGTKSFRLKDTQ
jgi:hypothetical protein